MNRRGYTGGHLGEYLEEYVDGTMPERQSQRAAQHVVACSTCRDDVAAEREILRKLRSVVVNPDRHAHLVAGLLAFAPDREGPLAPSVLSRESVAVIAPSSPAQYSGRHRTPIVCAAAVALGCVGIVAAVHATPHRTAPGEGQVPQLTSRQMLNDDVAAPHVQAAGYRSVPDALRSSGPVRKKTSMSGTIAP